MRSDDIDIPSAFYANVLNGSSTVPAGIRFWTLSSLIIQQALTHLDPQRRGMALRIVRCMPPQADGKIYSLLECYGQGSPPWKNNLESQAVLQGVESLSGQAVTMRKVVALHPYDSEQATYTVNGTAGLHNVSTASYPIQRSSQVAGCLTVSSLQANYFTPERHAVAQCYADLLAIVFDSHEFYEAHRIYLHLMPAPDEQRKYLTTFKQRVAALLSEGSEQKQQIDTHQAEMRTWQQFETEFLTMDENA
ncbi:hypothetical protein [Dictyobacter aurantiacus]|uniref:GAF domain-containing protein n=1 Tax=Dictyobacter aurantiacus TaxID=1936993 RepID=A0A401ZCD0_9CHLR|nr:hypothetical protein [Dictyobacter aurantiacus]GCE04509.1 hypothetical protein KDAU_18380 [Dictyobacter aurantiacus]